MGRRSGPGDADGAAEAALTPPLVVAALQAPTLLNIWASSDRWDLRVADLGGAGDLEEAKLLRVERYRCGDPLAVLVCHPEQIANAKESWPRAKIVWVLHNARHLSDDPAVDHWLALTDEIRRLAKRIEHYTVVTPAYEARPRWTWAPDRLWTMQSRPNTPEHPDPSRAADQLILDSVRTWAGLYERHTMYGQGQPGGFLDDEGRERLIAECSGYLSCLRSWAGFGLAQHEMLAAGVPLVANSWPGVGDWSHVLWGVHSRAVDLVRTAQVVCSDKVAAKFISESGLSFIEKHRTRQRMEEGIERLLDALR